MGSLCSLGASLYYNTRFDIRFPQAAATFTFSPHTLHWKGFYVDILFGGKMRSRNEVRKSSLSHFGTDSKARGCIIFSRNVHVKPMATNSALPPSFFSFSFRSLHNYPFFSQRDEYWISGVATYISSAVAASTWNLIICRVSGHTLL